MTKRPIRKPGDTYQDAQGQWWTRDDENRPIKLDTPPTKDATK